MKSNDSKRVHASHRVIVSKNPSSLLFIQLLAIEAHDSDLSFNNVDSIEQVSCQGNKVRSSLLQAYINHWMSLVFKQEVEGTWHEPSELKAIWSWESLLFCVFDPVHDSSKPWRTQCRLLSWWACYSWLLIRNQSAVRPQPVISKVTEVAVNNFTAHKCLVVAHPILNSIDAYIAGWLDSCRFIHWVVCLRSLLEAC